MTHVLVLPSFYPSEEEPLMGIFFKEQIEALQVSGIKVGVIYTELRSLRKLSCIRLTRYHFQVSFGVDNGVVTQRIHGWNVLPWMRISLWTYLSIRLIKRYIKRVGKPDLLHAHNTFWGGHLAEIASRKFDVPFVLTEHSSSLMNEQISDEEKYVIRKVAKNADRIITVSYPFAQRLLRHVNKDEIHVIPNMVNTSLFNVQTKRQSTPVVFLTVCFLTPIKGIDVLIRSFAAAFGNCDNVLLRIGGDGWQRKTLEQLVLDLGLGHKVTFLGALNRQQVQCEMSRATVFVSASYTETFGVAILEAMSSGLPVIATRCGGPEDIVQNGTGILVDPGNVDGLSRAMRDMYNRRSSYNPLEIHQYVADRFGTQKVTSDLVELYEHVILNSSAGRRM